MAIPSGYSLLGRIGYNDRGVYTENSDYVRGDVVYHEGSSYVALTTVTGVTPADDNTNWKYLARGFGATELSEIDATDTSGFAGDAGKQVKGQTLIDKIAEYVMSKVVATDAFQTYLQKFLVDNCVTDNPNLPLSAAQGKALQDALTVLNNELKNTENIALTDPEKFLKQISNVADIYGTAIKIVDKNGNDRIIYSSNLASRDFYFRSVGLTKTSTGTYIEFIAADDKKYKLLVDDIL